MKCASVVKLIFLFVFVLSLEIFAALPPVRVDDDHDGIDDALEQLLAETYAPVILIEPDESNYAVNVEWQLRRASLWYHEDCAACLFNCFECDDEASPAPSPINTQLNLLGSPWIHPDSFGSCHDETGQGSHCGQGEIAHRRISTIAPDPDGEGQTGYSDQTSFFIPDLADSDHVGSLEPCDWVTYFHCYPTANGGIIIQYWHTFAYNDLSIDEHGGDWDASIQVQLDANLNLQGVWFSRHSDDSPGTFMSLDKVTRYQGAQHIVMTIDGGGHAAFASRDDWCNNTYTAVFRLGTIIWTDNPDDPGSFRQINGYPGVGCTGSDPAGGGTVWKTWTGGEVHQYGSVTHSINTNPSPHGGLVNLGEYNPCTDNTCDGTKQASKLLAGEFYPLNDQIFIQFSGRWGSYGLIFNGPRGPVFQGFKDGVYTAWYNQGADVPASPSTNPWRVLPTSTLTINGPLYSAGGVDYISGKTKLELAATENAIAEQYGSPQMFYRFYTDLMWVFKEYSVPFSLSGPDGDAAYTVEYYALDALNNQEAARTRALTLDDTEPTITITQPRAIEYVHSATLTLNYGVTDAGSGVKNVTVKMDGATSLAGHGLASGQAISLLTELALGQHTFSVDAVDNVDNASTKAVTFTIIVTAQSIKGDVSQFVAAGKITQDEGRSLQAKLDSAAKARAKGDCANAYSIYTSFISEVKAQTGKKIDPAASQILIDDAQYLMTHCP